MSRRKQCKPHYKRSDELASTENGIMHNGQGVEDGNEAKRRRSEETKSHSKHSADSEEKMEGGLMLNQGDPSNQDQDQDSNVSLKFMAATKLAVMQHSSSLSNQKSPSPQPHQDALLPIPMILEQLVSLQQQQLQLTEQMCLQMTMMTPQSFHSALGAAVDPPKELGAHLSQQLPAAAASPSGSDSASISSGMFGQEMTGLDQSKDSSDALAGLHPINGNSLHGENVSCIATLQQMVDGLEKKTNEPNECVICHRVLHSHKSLRRHYCLHTGERSYKCKFCGSFFFTKADFEDHYGVHRADTPLKMHYSSTICIPITPLPENQFESPEALDASITENIDYKNIDSTCHEESMIEYNSTEPQPGANEDQAFQGPPYMLTGLAALENYIKSLASELNLQRQSTTASESDSRLKDSPSGSVEMYYKSGRSPAVSESVSCHSSSPVYGPSCGLSESPESTNPDDGLKSRPDSDAPRDFSENSGALDLMSNKEEPGLFFSKGKYGSSRLCPVWVPPRLGVQIPPETPMGALSLYRSQLPQGDTPATSSAPPRSTKQHLCKYCGKNFSSASALRIHKRTHKGKKPFTCQICGRAYARKRNLEVHVGCHV